jgi:transketolase
MNLTDFELRKGDMRSAYGNALVHLGTINENIVCVGADTTDSLKTKKFGDQFPERFFNIGIAEANLVSIAAGLAIAGKTAFASTYAAFLPGRCLDQIRNAICYPSLDVKLVVSHAGLTVGPDGASHQQIEDLAIMRSIPNIRVLAPADSVSVSKIIKNIAEIPGPFYVRLARPSSAIIYDDSDSTFQVGKANILQDGSDITIIGCGLMVYEALKTAKLLKERYNISARIIDSYSLKPLDNDMVLKAARETGAIITVEEHNIIGGLGSAVAEICSEHYPCYVKRVGVRDTFGESARDSELDNLLECYGLTEKEIERVVLSTLDTLKNENIS